eukprot:CAMPEP_0176087014 /NCGR_PEP_ID=MMETSP0120_2-20121206/43559_1 /TAXON_ID=160619 /ORGANISM="Kryptoperidinium foliaceum, Strain CCMP 1326" /LENGTH=128 /DNA_ID=CAMNT_0017420851 /DNA_START=71 /DNA_END=457 /DNA_ORIENTATION=-
MALQRQPQNSSVELMGRGLIGVVRGGLTSCRTCLRRHRPHAIDDSENWNLQRHESDRAAPFSRDAPQPARRLRQTHDLESSDEGSPTEGAFVASRSFGDLLLWAEHDIDGDGIARASAEVPACPLALV